MALVSWHTGAALVSLGFGFLILVLRKGTRLHKLVGRLYATAMFVMCVLSIFIHQINGGFSVFHLVSLQATALVGAGLAVPMFLRGRLKGWYVWHLRLMLYSYITLVFTGVAQGIEYLPFESKALNVILFVQFPAFVGWCVTEFWVAPKWRRRPPVVTTPVSS